MDLNIIGNGFDLYHGLPSSYYYFGCYLISNNPEFYEEVGKMYSLNHLEMVGPTIAHDYDYIVEDIFWSDFETHLSKVDEYFVVDTSEDDLGLEYSDPVEIEINNDLNADRLKECFVQWVRETLDKDINFGIIKRHLKKLSISNFNCDDYFLQFNYTHTLQELYGVVDERIHYVHGECFGTEKADLVIGHGNDQRIEQIRTIIEERTEDYNYTQRSYNRINEYECVLRYIKKLRKDVDGCKISCNYFYRSIECDVDNVNIYGHSLGDVDIPYLEDIRKIWPNAKWRFSYYSKDDKSRIKTVATNYLNLNENEFEIFKFSDPFSDAIQKEIIEEQSIVQYKSV